MDKMKIPTFALVALALLHGSTFAVDSGQVTLPLSEYLANLRTGASSDQLPVPPVGAAVTNATLALTASETALTGTATFSVATFSPGWHLVPLLGGPVSILRTDPTDAPLVTHAGGLAFLVQGTGHHRVTLDVASPTVDSE